MLARQWFLARDVQNLRAKEGELIQRLRHSISDSMNHVAQLVCYLYKTLWPKKVALHYLGRYLWTYSCMHQTLLQGPDPDSVANTDAFGNRQSLSSSFSLLPRHDMRTKVPLSPQHAPLERQADQRAASPPHAQPIGGGLEP